MRFVFVDDSQVLLKFLKKFQGFSTQFSIIIIFRLMPEKFEDTFTDN
jgi:hypothetical protein